MSAQEKILLKAREIPRPQRPSSSSQRSSSLPGTLCGDGVGETLAVAAPLVEVAVVPCCVQETINAAPIRTVMSVKTDFFIVRVRFESRRMLGRPLNSKQ